MHTNTVVIGAGHAGLAMSRCLADRGVEHVVLERGRLGERWRTARWDSFRLLTPAWMMRLPGHSYDGDRPRRLPDRAGAGALPGRLRSVVRRPGARDDHGHAGEPGRRRIPRAARTAASGDAPMWSSRPATTAARSFPPWRPACRRRWSSSTRRATGGPDLAARRRCAGRRRIGIRGSDRRRAGPVGPRRGARRRVAHPAAPALPRSRHPVVARPDGLPGPDHRRTARPGRGPAGAVVAAGRVGAPGRPGRAAGAGRPARRTPDRGRGGRACASPTTSSPRRPPPRVRLNRVLADIDRYAESHVPGVARAAAIGPSWHRSPCDRGRHS